MGTPLHIILAFTKEGVKGFRKGERRFMNRRHLLMLRRSMVKRGFEPDRSELFQILTERMHRTRRQYDSRYLMGIGREGAKGFSDWHTKVLVLTDVDMFTPGGAFVVGQAELNGQVALVSIARIKAGDERLFTNRLVKESLHELGHTLGSEHCKDNDCVMYSSKILPDSDVKSPNYCSRCRIKLGRSLSTG